MDIVKIAMIGLAGVMLALMLRQQKSEYALYISLAAAVLILVFSAGRLAAVMETIQKIEAYIRIDSAMVKILVKMIGITYVAEFATGICRDAGFGALGNQIEIPGSDRCYGLAADDRMLLVCEYGCGGENPEIILYKKRNSAM